MRTRAHEMLTSLPGSLVSLPFRDRISVHIEKCKTLGLQFIAGSCSISGVKRRIELNGSFFFFLLLFPAMISS